MTEPVVAVYNQTVLADEANSGSDVIVGRNEVDMSDALQALLDSGVLYFALGAFICIVLGAGAARRLFQGASKIKTPAHSRSYRRQRE